MIRGCVMVLAIAGLAVLFMAGAAGAASAGNAAGGMRPFLGAVCNFRFTPEVVEIIWQLLSGSRPPLCFASSLG
jgi:hypothetical protein